MRKSVLPFICVSLFILALASGALAATEQAKQAAIDAALVYLAQTQTINGVQGYWTYPSDGTLAATAAAVLAFVEEDYLPGTDFEMNGTNYGDVVGRGARYLLNHATVDTRFGVETAGYMRYAEDYNNDNDYTNDGGNDQAIYFSVGAYNRNVYTTGICTPTVFALGEMMGKDNVIGMGSAAVVGMTWAELMQDLVDWFSWGQVEPNRGTHRGGWRYDANYSTSDNSTAQWGALPYLYAGAWGLGSPNYVRNELALWADYVQNDTNGGSGYDSPTYLVNESKTGGLLLEFAVIGRPANDPSVLAAINYLNNTWNNSANSTWNGNLNHPYAMWAIYKGLSVYGLTSQVNSAGASILVGRGIDAATGGYTIGFDEDPLVSATDDWYSHYCDLLVSIQNANGSWTGYSNWYGPLATAWYVNILNATKIPDQNELDVYVDIKPTSCPNPVNAKSKGVLPVAILGTDKLDVMEIDPATVRFMGVNPILSPLPTLVEAGDEGMGETYVLPLRYAYEDVATAYTDTLEDCYSCSTEGPDGYLDMTLKFKTQEVVAAILEMLPPDTVLGKKFCLEAELTFELNGETYSGKDVILLMHAKMPVEELGAVAGASGFDGISPNPFNPITEIKYTLDQPGLVTLSVYNLAGLRVQTLVTQQQAAGSHSLTWDAGRQASGVYFLRLETHNQNFVKRVTLLK